jgi:excisionase family DNA binding protein
MKKIEIEGLSVSDLQEMLDIAVEKLYNKIKEEDKKPSDWEELTLEEAAEELRCSKRTITRRMKALKINGLKLGKEITLQRKDLKKIKAAQAS